MPITIPTPEPEATYQPTPPERESVTATPETFGYAPGVTQALSQLGQQAGQLATFAKIQADNTQIDAATAKIGTDSENLLRDPKTGVLSLLGENAWKPDDKGIGPKENAQKKFRESVNSAIEGLGNEDQKSAFYKIADKRYEEFNRAIDTHQFQQQKEYEKMTVNSLLTTEQNRAAAGYGDGQLIDDSIATQKKAIQHYAESNGMGSEWIKEESMKAESATHAGVIQRMLGDQQDLLAEKYYDTTKDTIDAKTRDQLDKMLETAQLRGGAAREADKILSSHPDSEEDALKAAEKIKDPRVQDAAEQLVSRHFTMLRQAKKNDQDQLFTSLGQQIDKKGLTDPVDIKESVSIPDWTKLTEPQRKALMNRASNDPTSPKKWMDFMAEVKAGNLMNMSQADMQEKWLPSFDLADKKRAMDMWADGKKGPGKLSGDMTSQQALDVTGTNAGLWAAETKNRSETQAKLFKQIDGQIHQNTLDFETTNKRDPKPTERQEIIDKAIIDYRMGQNKTRGFFASLDDPKRGQYVPLESIPEKEQLAMKQIGVSRGITMPPEKMERLFAAVQQKNVKRYKQILSE